MASVFHLGRIAVTHLGRCTASKIFQNFTPVFGTFHNFNYSFQPETLEEKNYLTWKVPHMHKGNTVEEILSLSEKITLLEAVNILGTLNKCFIQQQGEINKLKTDSRFISLCDMVAKECNRLNHASLIGTLRNILELGVSPDSSCVQFLENEVIWKSRKMNFKLLNICLKFHLPYQETELQKEVVQHLCKLIQLRWYEISDATDIIKLLLLGKCFQEQFLARIEDRALELAEKMTSIELHKILCSLGPLSRRPTPLLRAISFHLKQRAEKLNVKQMINTLFALNSLNFPDCVILQQITEGLLAELPFVEKENVISSILTTVGQLKWRHVELLEACGDWIQKHIEACRPQELVSYVLALARLNYVPEEADSIFNLILPRLTRINIENDILWLDVVWSLTLLDRVTKEHLFTVLQPQFYSPLVGVNDFQAVNSKLKLMTLTAVARLKLLPMPCVPFEPSPDILVPRSEEAQKMSQSVIDGLHNFLPEEKYMKSNLHTSLGIFIDAEFIVDKKGKPVPLSEFGLQAGNRKTLKHLPENFYRIAVLVWNYKDLTLNSQALVGSNALFVRLLKMLGYTVVEVPYTEYNDLGTTVKKVNYLQEKILNSVHNSRVATHFSHSY